MMKITLFRRWTLKGKLWFWHARARNGKIMATGGEGYWNRTDAEEAIGKVQCSLPLAEIEVQP